MADSETYLVDTRSKRPRRPIVLTLAIAYGVGNGISGYAIRCGIVSYRSDRVYGRTAQLMLSMLAAAYAKCIIYGIDQRQIVFRRYRSGGR